jgi:hypothetical protein
LQSIWEGHVDQEIIEEAIRNVEHETGEFVPNMRRVENPHPDEDDESDQPPLPLGDTSAEALHAEVRSRLTHLEDAIEMIKQQPGVAAGMGHNKPPGPVDDIPIDMKDVAEIEQAAVVLKAQPVEPADQGKAAEAAAATIKTKAEKIKDWLAKHGEEFVSEASKAAGKQFGTWGPHAFWMLMLERLFGVSDIVLKWLKVLPPF